MVGRVLPMDHIRRIGTGRGRCNQSIAGGERQLRVGANGVSNVVDWEFNGYGQPPAIAYSRKHKDPPVMLAYDTM